MTNHFAGVVLPEALRHTLEHMGYKDATPIQMQAIPVALEGKDILGSAQTGTGKTAAFSVPLVAKLLSDPMSSALVMTPTRELAMQVMDIISQLLGKQTKIKKAVLIGGASMGLQLRDLRNNPRIIVGTPGRINDHLKRKTLNLSKTNFLVLDETDRMLDMGFSAQIDLIVSKMPKERQTLMFSATMPDNIVRLAQKDLINPIRITVGSTTAPIVKIKQDVIYTNTDEKYGHLTAELEKRQGTVIIFVKTKRNTDKLGAKLKKDGHSVDVIHGDLRQGQRKRVIDAFRDMQHRILVATDVAARGLDIHHIEHVINYDLPQVPEDYIHRIGRTGRNGQEGSALCLISPDDKRLWRAIEKMMDPSVKHDPADEKADRASKGRGFKGRKQGGSGDGGGFKKKYGAAHGGDKRRDERRFDDRPRGERKEGETGYGKKSFGGAAHGEKKFGDKPRGERKFDDRPRSDRPHGERKESGEKKSFGRYDDKGPRGPRAKEDRPYRGDRPNRSSGSSYAPRGDRNEARGDRPERNFNDNAYQGRNERAVDGNRHGQENRADGNKAHGEKRHGDKKFGDKSRGDKKPWDKKKADGNHSGNRDGKPGEKKHWEKKDGGHSGLKKKFDKPFGTPKFSGMRKRDMNPENNTGGR